MKRSTVKFVIRRETVRVLSGMELVRVAGGVGTDNVCTKVPLADSAGAGTGCPVAKA
jgi:hypothetical protein